MPTGPGKGPGRKPTDGRDRRKQTGLKAWGVRSGEADRGQGRPRERKEEGKDAGPRDGGGGTWAVKRGWGPGRSPGPTAKGQPLAANLPVTCNRCHERARSPSAKFRARYK